MLGLGNAWAAAGMLRVLETIRHSKVSREFEGQTANLTSWVEEIVSATWKHQVSVYGVMVLRFTHNVNIRVPCSQQTNGTLLNVLDDPNSFADTSSTALLAASTFRLAVITGDYTHLPAAVKAFQLIEDSLTEDGWLLNTVDPLTFNTPSQPGVFSPEGQAFTLLLQAAWRDLVEF